MAEETTSAPEVEIEEVVEQKIMCFVSKKMVPTSSTVEVEYAPRKLVRVLPKYIKYEA